MKAALSRLGLRLGGRLAIGLLLGAAGCSSMIWAVKKREFLSLTERHLDAPKACGSACGYLWIVRDDDDSVASYPWLQLFATSTGILAPLDELTDSDLLILARPAGKHDFAVGRLDGDLAKFSATVNQGAVTVIRVGVAAQFVSGGYYTTYNVHFGAFESAPQPIDKPAEAAAALRSASWSDRLGAVGALREAQSSPGVQAVLASTARYDRDPRVRSVAKAALKEPQK